MAPEDRDQIQPPIEVEIRSPDLAIVTLRGEHDASTKPEVTQALALATDQLNVLVDLRECSYIDSATIGMFVAASQRLNEHGGGLHVVVPQHARVIRRVMEVMGIDAILPIHETRTAGLASIQSG
jgi:anti-anti-sigma factor